MIRRSALLVLWTLLGVACRGEPRPPDRSVASRGEDTTTSAPRSAAVTDTLSPAQATAPTQADTIVLSNYTHFVRPLSRLGVSPKDSDDFTPYGTEMESDTFSFVVGSEHYVIDPNGRALRSTRAGNVQRFALALDTGMYVERVSFTRVQGDPVFLYQQTDNEASSSFVARFDVATLQPKWVVRVPGFNLGFALLDDANLYVTCFGFVGKLDLTGGSYIWRHDNLYQTEGYNYFGYPRIVDGAVEIPANGGRLFVAERGTGRRIKQ